MKDQELLKALVDAKLLGEEESQRLLKESESLKRSAEDIIYSRNLVPEEEVAKVKSAILKIPYRKLDPDSLDEAVLKFIPGDTARAYRAVPITKNGDLLVVGMVHPDDPSAQSALKFLAKQARVNLGVYLVTPSDVDLMLKRFSPFAQEIQAALQSFSLRDRKSVV